MDDGQSTLQMCHDIDNNGIVNRLHFMNLKIRYPGLTSPKLTKVKVKDDRLYKW